MLSIANKSKDMRALKKNKLNKMGLNGFNFAIENFNRKKLSQKYIYELKKVG